LLEFLSVSKADDLQQRTDAFADLSIKFVDGLPDTLIARRLGAQYLDASTSVAANYRAARRGRSHAEFTAKIGVVSEEADESVFWLKRLATANIASTVANAPLLAEAEELARIFYASAKTARSRRRRPRPDDPPPR
jgi:four helix bundle protein